MSADLSAYVPQLLLQWHRTHGERRHVRIDGSLVFADVSGFTRLSERLATRGGKLGAEQVTEVVGTLFGDLLTTAAELGGQMLKYGGDAVLLLFNDADHARRAAAAASRMQTRIREIGRVDTGAGAVRLRMSVGVNSGPTDLFVAGSSHAELVVAGPAATSVATLEAAADPGQVLLSEATASQLDERDLGARSGVGVLLRTIPDVPGVAPRVPPDEVDPSPFLSPALLDHLRTDGRSNQHRLVAQAFVHVVGLDDALIRGPNRAASELHETISAIQEACDHYDISFLATDLAPDGTKAILVSGAPRAVEGAERRMLLALRHVIEQGTPLAIRAGVNRGHVFTGDVGPPFRRTYTTIGDVTNTAARVMSRAQAGEVLTLSAVTDVVGDEFEVTTLEPFYAKGKREPLTPYRVERHRDTDDIAVKRPDALPFVGRDAELDVLLDAERDAVAGSGGLVEILGPTGHGKSRLVHELVSRSRATVRTLRCEHYERTTPYYPFRYLLRSVLGLDTLPRDEWPAALHDRLGPVLDGWMPLLGDVLDLALEETTETCELAPRFRVQRTAQVVEAALAEVLRDPTIMVFEDVQWADASSSELLARLEVGIGDRPWLLVVTSRTDAEDVGFRACGGPATVTVELGNLDPAAADILIDDVAPDLPLHVRSEILQAAEGNPLFLESLLRGSGAGAGSVPTTVEDVLATEIDALPMDAQQLVQVASVLGTAFSAPLFAELTAQPSRGARAIAGRSGVVLAASGQVLSFRHQLLREVVYERMPYRHRAELHARAAGLLERRIETGEDRHAVLSMHLWHAGQFEACWERSREAGDRAGAKYANVEAMALYERALGAARRAGIDDDDELADVAKKLARAAQLAGDRAQWRAALRIGRAHSKRRPAQYAELCRAQSRLAEYDGRRDLARRWLRRGLRALEGIDMTDALAAQAMLTAQLAWTKLDDGRPGHALTLAQRALQDAERTREEETMAVAHSVIDKALAALDRDDPDGHAERAIELYDGIGALAEKAVMLNGLGTTAYHRGDWTTALALYEESRDGCRRTGNVTDAGTLDYNIAEILCDQGRCAEAHALLDEAESLWRSIDFGVGLLSARGLRGRLLLCVGDAGGALSLLDDACATLHANGLHAHAIPFDLARAEALLALDRLGEAEELLDELEVHAASRPGLDAGVRRVRAGLLHRRGHTSLALRGAREAVDRARLAGGAAFELALALDLLVTLSPDTSADEAAERDAVLRRLGVEHDSRRPALWPTGGGR